MAQKSAASAGSSSAANRASIRLTVVGKSAWASSVSRARGTRPRVLVSTRSRGSSQARTMWYRKSRYTSPRGPRRSYRPDHRGLSARRCKSTTRLTTGTPSAYPMAALYQWARASRSAW